MTQIVVLLMLGAFCRVPSPLTSSTTRFCTPSSLKNLATPRIQKFERYKLELKWDAHTPREKGQGTTNSKLQAVKTDDQGRGEWVTEVRGYPAGELRARVTDSMGVSSDWSPAYDVPWIY
jgi:hypothetical protein